MSSSSSSSSLSPSARRQNQREESNTSVAQQNWLKLPKDLVITIGERLNLDTDYIQFRSICKSWNSFLPVKPYHFTHFPVLILRYMEPRARYTNCMFGLANNKIYQLRYLLPWEFLHDYSCKGSIDGWLVMSNSCLYGESIYIFNPFTKAKFPLPYIRGRLLQKVVLSRSTPPAAVALYDYSGDLMFSKPGDKEWTFLNSTHGFVDVLFHGNKIYALQHPNKVYVFNMGADMKINSSSCSIHQPQLDLRDEFMSYMEPSNYLQERYLVESSNNVLMVVRVIDVDLQNPSIPGRCRRNSQHRTIYFIVFKWEQERWLHIKSIGDQMLFVGLASSLSVSSLNFPDYRGNIYFTDGHIWDRENLKRDYDKGVFSLKDECIVSSLPLQGCTDTNGNPWKLTFRYSPAWLTYNIQPMLPPC